MNEKYAWIRIRKSTKDRLDTWAKVCDKKLIDMFDDMVNAFRDTIIIGNVNRLANSQNADDVFAVANEVAKSIVKRDNND
jgi:hypothetical protein